MNKIYIRRTISILFIILTVGILFYLYLPPWPSSIDYMNNTVGENKVDVIFLGSSHVYNGIDPIQLYDDYGIASYDLTEGGQAPWQSYCFIKELDKTQTPKLLVLEAYTLGARMGEGDYWDALTVNNLINLPFSFNKLEALHASVGENKLDVILRFPYSHGRYYEFKGLTINKRKGFYNYDMGYIKREEIEPCDVVANISDITESEPLSEKHEYYLRKSIEYCKDNDIELLIVLVPWMKITPEDQKHYNCINDIASEYSVPFINGSLLADQIGIDYAEDSYDAGDHLNNKGAVKYTEWLGDYLVNNYNLPDRRGQEDYCMYATQDNGH